MWPCFGLICKSLFHLGIGVYYISNHCSLFSEGMGVQEYETGVRAVSMFVFVTCVYGEYGILPL